MYQDKVVKILRKKKIEIGDTIEVRKGKRVFSGILMPRIELGDTNCLVLKLDNGYNIGIKFAKGLKIKKLKGKTRAKEKPKPKLSVDKSKPTISILHTGGTIASRLDYRTGGVVASFKPEDIVEMFPELNDIANIRSVFLGNLLSENLRFGHYNKMAKAIEKEIRSGVDGVIVTHGTDTLAYTSAALAFVLEDLPKPVILVGAQRSSDRGSSDAAMNLICAALFIGASDFGGVGICMHESEGDVDCVVLPPCKTRKMHTSRRDAFRPVNAKPIAKINYQSGRISFLTEDYPRINEKKLRLRLFDPKVKVAILKAHTNMWPQQIDFYRKHGYDGVVLEGTGLGHMPIEATDKESEINHKNKEAIEKLCRNAVVVMTSQCIYGRVNMNVYDAGRDLQRLGVVGNFLDMLPEVAFIKLAWLLSNYTKDKTKELFSENLRGEIVDRSQEDEFLW